MACQLTADVTHIFDFTAVTGARVTVFVDSDSGAVHLTAATLDGAPLAVAGDRTSFTTAAGTNQLNLGFVAADPDETFRIKEDCGGGSSQLLANWRLQPSQVEPGGPTRAFRIHAQ